MLNKTSKKRYLVHIGFEIGILIKGIDSFLEVVGGFLLLLLNPVRLNKLILLVTQHELSEDPNDKISGLLIALGHNFSVSTQYFGVFYLVSHGTVKLLLVCLLWRKKLWAYPLTIVSLVLFIIYQMYRFTITHSIFLILLTIFDITMIGLIFMEYKKIKSRELLKAI